MILNGLFKNLIHNKYIMFENYEFKSVRSAAVLTGSYVAGTTIVTRNAYNQAVIYLNFTIGSLTSLELKVEFSNDNSTFYQETASSVSGGTSTDTILEHTYSATGKYRIPISIKDRYIKISVKGTGTVTSSSAAVDLVLGTV